MSSFSHPQTISPKSGVVKSFLEKTHNRQPYSYSPLSADLEEIRLVTLSPGTSDDPICITINHVPFCIVPRESPLKVVTQEHRDSLPPEWNVFITLEGDRFIYEYTNPVDGSEVAQWTHPNPDAHFDDVEGSSDVEECAKPNYEALSYTWSLSEYSQSAFYQHSSVIIIRSSSTDSESQLNVGKNLALALKYLRYPNKPRTLWIDAICINQMDRKERASQVSRMHKIYKLADRVLVWLGPQYQNSKLAISVLTKIGSQVEVTQKGFMASPGSTEPWTYHFSYKLLYDQDTWEAIYDLIRRPWFERVWIMQEILLASTKSEVTCGKDIIPWYTFRRAIICLVSKVTSLPKKLYHSLSNAPINRLCKATTIQNLPASLSMVAHAACSEEIDRIYGILGLIPRKIASRIVPNYQLTAPEAFRNIFLEYLSLTQRLDLIRFCNIEHAHQGMPTWIPNWAILSYSRIVSSSGVCASGFSSSHTRYYAPLVLEAVGVRCARVGVVGSIIRTEEDLYDIINTVGVKDINTNHLTGESLLDAWAWTLSTGLLKDRFMEQGKFTSLEEFKTILVKQKDSSTIVGENSNGIIASVTHNVGIGLVPFSTEEGYCGIGARTTHPGTCFLFVFEMRITTKSSNR
jgi:hypothetical protein